jgi:hypothetical protein
MASWLAFEQLTSVGRRTGVALRRLTRKTGQPSSRGIFPCRRGLRGPCSLAWRTDSTAPEDRQPARRHAAARCHNSASIESWNKLSISDRRLSWDFNPVDYLVVSQWPPCRYSPNPTGRYLEFVNGFRYLREQPAAYGLQRDIPGALQRPQRRTGGHRGPTSRDRRERTSRFAYS